MASGDIAVTIRFTNIDEAAAWCAEYNDRPEGWTDPNARPAVGPNGTLRFDQLFPNPPVAWPVWPFPPAAAPIATCPRCFCIPCACSSAIPTWFAR